jgi:SAM-dependent methyltransferase
MPENPKTDAVSAAPTFTGAGAALGTLGFGVNFEVQPQNFTVPRRAAAPPPPRGIAASTSLLDAILKLAVIEELHPRDSMFTTDQHYFSVGRAGLANVMTALYGRLSYPGGDTPIKSILDFGCGYGRVARYLRAAFPDARLDVSDYDPEGVAWCVKFLGASDIAGKVPEDSYDLIWLGSVFTHLPEATIADLIATLKRGLRRYGVLMYTTQGELSAFNLEHFAQGDSDRRYIDYGLSKEAAAVIVADYRAHGFGYQDYHGREGYGIAIGTMAWYAARTTDRTTLLLLAQEQGWDVHHDVLAFLRVDDATNMPRGRLFRDWTASVSAG